VISFLEWWFRVYAVTEKRVIQRAGLLRVTRRFLQLEDVVSVRVNLGLNQYLGVGDVEVSTAGMSGKVYMHNISAPNEVRDSILQIQERLRQEATQMQIEEITKRLKQSLCW